MSSNNPAILAPISVAAAENGLSITIDSATHNVVVNAAAVVYDDINDLLGHLKTALDALGHGTFTCAVDTSSSPVGKVTLSNGTTFALLFSSGGTYSGANSLARFLGFTYSNFTTATSHTSNYQHQGGWYADRPPATDTLSKPEFVGGQMRRTLSGQHSKQLQVATRHSRTVVFNELAKEIIPLANATGANTNRDFETFWTNNKAAQAVRYCPDQTALTTYSTVYIVEPTNWLEQVTRPHVDIETYNMTLTLDTQEA